MAAAIGYDNTAQMVEDQVEKPETEYYELSENEEELRNFVVDHTDRWRDYRDQNNMDNWLKYERIFRGQFADEDKTRASERSKVISPATQQAVETRHAEIMEAIFGQGEFFDMDTENQQALVPLEKLKKQLYDDFAQDKIRKAFDQIALLAEIYGTGIGEITVGKEKQFVPMSVPMGDNQMAYGTGEQERITVKLNPINPKNFLFDPNGTSIDDCMGVAVERYVGVHKVMEGVKSGKYLNVDISTLYVDDSLDATQEVKTFEDQRVLLLTYYGLVPREYMTKGDEDVVDVLGEDNEDENEDTEDYTDMVEAIVIIANGDILLKCEESPYMMKDRPILSYQADTVPGRLLGRGTVEKSINMQAAIDGSMRSHMDSLALTGAPMVAMDATRLPRGAKFEVKPGKAILTNGPPADILMPFKFGQTDGQAMETSKEFERMLLMATATMDSNGQVSQVARDSGGLDMATATMIKKYKRVLVNFQEDFLIPFIYKCLWRRMQFDPQRYPASDIKVIPTATLGIIAREYEQKQLAFLIQTLGAQSPLTPILMQGIVKNSSLTNREEMLAQMQKMSQPDPQQQQMQMMAAQKEMQLKDAEIAKKNAEAQKATVEAQLAPEETKAKVISALSNNLDDNNEQADFEKRARIAELMLKEKEVDAKHRSIEANLQIADKQLQADRIKAQNESSYLKDASGA